MKTVVVYESMWGNTAQIAEAIAIGLGDVPLMDAALTSAADLADADLLVLGGPTHALTMSRVETRGEAHREGAAHGASGRGMRELIHELPPHLQPRCATFDTSIAAMRFFPGSAAKAAARELRRRHGADVVATRSFYVEGLDGPLVTGELVRAVEWGVQLATLMGAAGHSRDAQS